MRILIALALSLVLAGCSTVGLNLGTPSGGLDASRDDLSSLVIAFDLPRGLGPSPTAGQLFTFDVANGGPSEHLRLTLEPADADLAISSLPPPAEGRAYYLFDLKDADKLAIRAAQTSAQQRGVTESGVKLGIVPKLCNAGPYDANAMTISVFAVVPGRTGLLPFLKDETLAQLLTQPGSTQMPACA